MKGNKNYSLLNERILITLIHAEMRCQAFFCFVIPITTLIGIFADILPLVQLPPILSFVLFFIYGFPKQFYDGNEWISSMLAFDYPFISPKKKILLRALVGLCVSLVALSFFVLISYGGNPEIENSVFVIKSHGQMIRTISEHEYKILYIFDRYTVLPLFYICTVCSYYLSKNDFLNQSHSFTK